LSRGCQQMIVDEAQHGVDPGELGWKMQRPDDGQMIVLRLLGLCFMYQLLQHCGVNSALPHVGPASARGSVRIRIALECEIGGDDRKILTANLKHDEGLRL